MLISPMDGSLVWSNRYHQSGTLMPSGAVHPIIPGLVLAHHPGMMVSNGMFHLDHVLARQEPPDRRHEEKSEIDRKADAPQDRAKRRTIAEIGEHIGDAHDQKKNSQFIDQALRAFAK